MERNERKQAKLSSDLARALMVQMGERADWKSRKAREWFRRPGFAYTPLCPDPEYRRGVLEEL